MFAWNVVATAQPEGFREAEQILGAYGELRRTGFFNVLVLRVDPPRALLEPLAHRLADEPGLMNFISHVMPADATFDFADPAGFEAQARDIALGWTARLADRSFHVRMHRRGFKGRLRTPDEERFLDDALLGALQTAGTAGRIAFTDPDAVLAVETVGNRAGLSLWRREEIRRYPLLGLG